MLSYRELDAAIEAHGDVVRVLLADTTGSTPRDIGANMMVWLDGQTGSIGGGRLEFDAAKTARAMLQAGPQTRVLRDAPGPSDNPHRTGAATLVYEKFDADRLKALKSGQALDGMCLRRVEDTAEAAAPAKFLQQAVDRLQDANGPSAVLGQGWLAERLWRARQPVYIYGAGHVGRALAQLLSPLPQFEVTLIDVRREQLCDLPDTVQTFDEALPTDIMALAPDEAAHFIMTPEHDYDLELCHRLLGREFAYAGLIGSRAKWARFRARLAELGHSEQQIGRVNCPIGTPALGKHPQAIAVGVVAGLLRRAAQHTNEQRNRA